MKNVTIPAHTVNLILMNVSGGNFTMEMKPHVELNNQIN